MVMSAARTSLASGPSLAKPAFVSDLETLVKAALAMPAAQNLLARLLFSARTISASRPPTVAKTPREDWETTATLSRAAQRSPVLLPSPARMASVLCWPARAPSATTTRLAAALSSVSQMSALRPMQEAAMQEAPVMLVTLSRPAVFLSNARKAAASTLATTMMRATMTHHAGLPLLARRAPVFHPLSRPAPAMPATLRPSALLPLNAATTSAWHRRRTLTKATWAMIAVLRTRAAVHSAAKLASVFSLAPLAMSAPTTSLAGPP